VPAVARCSPELSSRRRDSEPRFGTWRVTFDDKRDRALRVDVTEQRKVRAARFPPRLEQPPRVSENDGLTTKRGTDSGTLGDDSSFADAVAAVMRLPLSDAGQAETVRRLLARNGRGQ
jgi:hypothetical protein